MPVAILCQDRILCYKNTTTMLNINIHKHIQKSPPLVKRRFRSINNDEGDYDQIYVLYDSSRFMILLMYCLLHRCPQSCCCLMYRFLWCCRSPMRCCLLYCRCLMCRFPLCCRSLMRCCLMCRFLWNRHSLFCRFLYYFRCLMCRFL